nr:unnamed protein product [Digitaria exilis]
MDKDGGPDWNGLLKWSLAHGDGTNPPRALSEEDRKWFMEAMQANTIDVVKRMKEITQVMKTPEDVLESQGVTPENIEALNLIQYLLHNDKTDRSIATELGLPKLMMHLASSDDSLVREAALSGLLELAQDKTSGNSLPDQDKLKDILKTRIEGISIMDKDDLHAAREERQLVDSLWKECYNEPSSLREKGLVVLPGEDAPQQPPPDVAGKMFEPPLRAWAAARPAPKDDSDAGSEKKDAPPLLLGPGPSSNSNS